MNEIYVYGPNDSGDGNDYSTFGLVGPLIPSECTFTEILNGESSISMKHPIDDFGRYAALVRGNILSVPVPVRTTPEIQNGRCVTTVYTYKVRPWGQIHTNQRILYKKNKGSGKLKVLPYGEPVTIVSKTDNTNDRWKVKTRYGTGYIYGAALEDGVEHLIGDNSQAIEEIQSPWSVAPQFFRIYEVTKGLDSIEVSARHIFYDLLYNMTSWNSKGWSDQVPLEHALSYILRENVYNKDHGFEYHTNVDDKTFGADYSSKNLVEALLSEEDGICARYGVTLIRDNYDLYFLHDPGTNRGIRILYGKNMTGISYKESDDEVATRLIPTGENKNGSDLYLDGTIWIDSPHINDYPVPHIYKFKCEECKVGEKEGKIAITAAIARQRMRAQTQKLLEAEVDLPKIEVDVEFQNLGDTEEYKELKELEKCFLSDYILVQYPKLNVDITARITEIEWDCLLGKMKSVKVGQVGKTLANTGITSWQIPNGVSGSKIASASISSAQLDDDIINVRHMQADSVNAKAIMAESIVTEKLAADSVTANKIAANAVDTKQLNANSVTSEKIAAGAVTADKIAAGTITAKEIEAGSITADRLDANTVTAEVADIAKAQITDANIKSANIHWAEIDTLSAAVADIVKLQVATGSFTLAEIQNLLANALVVEQVSAELVHVRNLLVTEANMLNATINNLVIKASDGSYWKVNVDSDGKMTTVQTEASTTAYESTYPSADIQALTGNYVGESAVFKEITGEAISAGKLTAMQATIASAVIPELQVTALTALGNILELSANMSIQSVVGDAVGSTRDDLTSYINSKDAELSQSMASLSATSSDALNAATAALYSKITQEKESIRSEINAENIKAYMHYDMEGLRIGKSNQIYNTLQNGIGFHIEQRNDMGGRSVISSFARRSLFVENVRVGTVSNNGTQVESSGVVVMKGAPDGGVMFSTEGN